MSRACTQLCSNLVRSLVLPALVFVRLSHVRQKRQLPSLPACRQSMCQAVVSPPRAQWLKVCESRATHRPPPKHSPTTTANHSQHPTPTPQAPAARQHHSPTNPKPAKPTPTPTQPKPKTPDQGQPTRRTTNPPPPTRPGWSNHHPTHRPPPPHTTTTPADTSQPQAAISPVPHPQMSSKVSGNRLATTFASNLRHRSLQQFCRPAQRLERLLDTATRPTSRPASMSWKDIRDAQESFLVKTKLKGNENKSARPKPQQVSSRGTVEAKSWPFFVLSTPAVKPATTFHGTPCILTITSGIL